MLLNEKVNSLELQLMGDVILDGTDITQQLEELYVHCIQIDDSLHQKQAALGVDKCAYLTLLC